ncbi:hypothetical protein LTR09_008880 [Extremus antarcticus]|uniref:Uncharacterized protein n=1 Tax=Extremus antarcticus TaxID=702011 RepID=A0AAJ0G6N0_9PEZI|nr:hypothetical protein LTR09_008880 [Extremus antarcticus]
MVNCASLITVFMTLFIGINFENLGYSKAEREIAWNVFAGSVDSGETPGTQTILSSIYIAIRIVLSGYGLWSMVEDFMLRGSEMRSNTRMREESHGTSNEKGT